MNYLEREIVNGRKPEENIPQFAVNLMKIYQRYSYVKLSMNYFTFYEMTVEAGEKNESICSLTKRVNEVVKNMVNAPSYEEIQESMKSIFAVRTEIMDIMKGLTSLIDIFNIYEYCCNRVEYSYKDGSDFLKISDEELTRDILQYILSDKDQVVVNTKIAEMVRQIPIRLTKAKFFEMVREGLKVYKDSEKGSVDDFLYMLRTVSMLDISEYADQFSEEINEIRAEFQKVDFSALDEEGFNQLSAKLHYAVDCIQAAVDKYMLLEEVVNDICVVLLSSKTYLCGCMPDLAPYYEKHISEVFKDIHEIDNCQILVQKENELFLGTDYETLAESIEDGFLYLEGKQEKYSNLFQKYSYLTETICKDHKDVLESLGLLPLEDIFARIEKLVSGSVFVPFEEESGKHETAGMDYILKSMDKLEADFMEFFKNNQRPVCRAVMAHVLSELPIFFHNMDAVKDYVYNGISGCRNQAEKAAVIEIFKGMMEEE